MLKKCSNDISLGWFRLHEATSKNEHERAFLNYRLLMHSYNDIAFAKQAKGDLHYFFDEIELAVKNFHEAFFLYLEKNNLFHAFVLLNHIKKCGLEIPKEATSIVNREKKKKKFSLLFE